MFGKRRRFIGQAGAIILGISKALISHDENLKKNLKINLPRETQEWLSEKIRS